MILQIFGPVLVVLPFRTAKEAVSLANNSMYGLAGSVWTENVSLAMEVALSVKVRKINIFYIQCKSKFVFNTKK